MSLAKRNSRLITVDGIKYRWVFSESLNRETQRHRLYVTIQHASGVGSKIFGIGTCETIVPFLQPALIVTPGIVAQMIRHATKDGWVSGTTGEDYRIVDLERFAAD